MSFLTRGGICGMRALENDRGSSRAWSQFPIQLMMRRFGAGLVDYSLFVLFFIVYVKQVGTPADDGSIVIRSYLQHLGWFIAWLLYFPVLEGAMGYTLGKGLFDLKVITARGNRPSFIRSLVRHLLDPLDLVVFVFLLPISTSLSNVPRRLGDYCAGTWVVRDN